MPVRVCPLVSICMCVRARVCTELFQMILCISAPPLPCPVMSQPQPVCVSVHAMETENKYCIVTGDRKIAAKVISYKAIKVLSHVKFLL